MISTFGMCTNDSDLLYIRYTNGHTEILPVTYPLRKNRNYKRFMRKLLVNHIITKNQYNVMCQLDNPEISMVVDILVAIRNTDRSSMMKDFR